MGRQFALMVLGACLVASSLHATSAFYDFSVEPNTVNDNNKPVSGTVRFIATDSECFGGAGVTCLLVDILNDQSGISKVNQSISDLSFHVFVSGKEVLTNGILYAFWYSNVSKDPITEVSKHVSGHPADNTVQGWHLDPFNSTTGMHLDALGGGQADHLIGCCAKGQSSPYLAGHILFEIDGIPNMSVQNLGISGVEFSYGNKPGGFVTGACLVSGDCAAGGNVQETPEPLSLSLVGSGLLAFGIIRRRRRQ